MMRRTLFLLLLSGPGLGSCTYDNAEELLESQPVVACDLTAVTYQATISPILARNCRSCHNGTLLSGNISLETHAQVKRLADNGLLVGVTSHAAGFDPMPQGAPKLSDCDISRIRQWVTNGAPDN